MASSTLTARNLSTNILHPKLGDMAEVDLTKRILKQHAEWRGVWVQAVEQMQAGTLSTHSHEGGQVKDTTAESIARTKSQIAMIDEIDRLPKEI